MHKKCDNAGLVFLLAQISREISGTAVVPEIGDGPTVDVFDAGQVADADVWGATQVFWDMIPRRLMAQYVTTVPSKEVLYDHARRHIEQIVRTSGALIPLSSRAYPPLLRHIRNPPHCLFTMGSPTCFSSGPLVAVVGARKAARESLDVSRGVSAIFVQAGCTIVSGGAVGCDGAAHRGSRDPETGMMRTIVVLAGGLGTIYPECHAPLFRDIVALGGILVSEGLWWNRARRFDFARRNRIIAGMSHLTIVIQAGAQSGALITVRHALSEGRDIFVYDGPADDVRFTGNHRLIDEGAVSFRLPFSSDTSWGYSEERKS